MHETGFFKGGVLFCTNSGFWQQDTVLDLFFSFDQRFFSFFRNILDTLQIKLEAGFNHFSLLRVRINEDLGDQGLINPVERCTRCSSLFSFHCYFWAAICIIEKEARRNTTVENLKCPTESKQKLKSRSRMKRAVRLEMRWKRL